MKYINERINVIREKYFKTHNDVFPNDELLWNEDIIKNKIEQINLNKEKI